MSNLDISNSATQCDPNRDLTSRSLLLRFLSIPASQTIRSDLLRAVKCGEISDATLDGLVLYLKAVGVKLELGFLDKLEEGQSTANDSSGEGVDDSDSDEEDQLDEDELEGDETEGTEEQADELEDENYHLEDARDSEETDGSDDEDWNYFVWMGRRRRLGNDEFEDAGEDENEEIDELDEDDDELHSERELKRLIEIVEASSVSPHALSVSFPPSRITSIIDNRLSKPNPAGWGKKLDLFEGTEYLFRV